MNEENPKVRFDIQAFPVEHEGRRVFLIQDHLGLVPENVLFEEEAIYILQLLDGRGTLRDIQETLSRASGGEIFSMEEVEDMINKLDSFYLLESSRFNQAKEDLMANFVSAEIREPYHAGRSYPVEVSAIEEFIDDSLSRPIDTSHQEPFENLKGLIVPHIHFGAGVNTYGSGYKLLKGQKYDRVIILGIGHQIIDGLFSITDKDFVTPLGTVATDKDAVDLLLEAGDDLICDNDFAHRTEHSIEFQLLYLQHLLGSDKFKIIPILTGNFDGIISEYDALQNVPGMDDFIDALSKEASHSDTLLIAGVDLSHIGYKFGNSEPAMELEQKARDFDLELLEAIKVADQEKFWSLAKSSLKDFNVCGLSALSILLAVVPRLRGHLLNYDMWHEKQTFSAVSFAAMALTQE